MDPSAQNTSASTATPAPTQSTSNQQAPPAISSTAMGLSQQQQNSTDLIRRLGERVEKSPVPSELKEKLIERIQRLALLRASAGFMSASYIMEYETTAAYINWVVNLPWDKSTQDVLNIVTAKQILDKNHYGLSSVKDRILEYLASIILNTKNKNIENVLRAPILCLVGLAGTGKTTIAASMAEALGRKFERIPFGGMGDSRALRGQSRVFPDAEPGYIIKKLTSSQSKNSVFLLDELDRISEAARSDVMGVLIEMLDPEQNKAYIDHYIDYPFDLSRVLFIATANSTTHIATAVLDRLEIIQLPSYSDEEKKVIGKTYLFPKVYAKSGLLSGQITIDDTAWPEILRPLGFDAGMRSLNRTIEGICRRVARLVVEGKVQSMAINSQNIKEFLPSI